VFDTGVRQFRMVLGMVSGRRIDPANLRRLIDDARATIAEFGEPGDDARSVTDGPLTDASTRREFADRALARTAKRLAEQSPFYGHRFAEAGVKRPDRLGGADMTRIPVTVKADLIARAAEFLCADAPRHLATRTTGTTGKPAEIWLSEYEMSLWPALGALNSVLRDGLRPTDLMQVGISSRATASIQLDVAICQLTGTGCRILGLVPPDEALDSLVEGGVTLLSAVPSYLGELVVAARRRGMGPSDFTLRRVDCGGEVLSPSLAAAAAQTFGVERVNDLFGMTEVIPVTGRTCEHGHLHHDLNTGHVETLDPSTGAPARPGELATVVITPYFPYRDCTPVFRYDTRDVVRCLPEGPLACELAGLPGTSKVLGKADQLLRLAESDVVTPRQLVEAVESLPTEPWPARFRATVHDGQLRLTLPTSAVAGLGTAGARAHLADHGMDADLDLVPDECAPRLRTLRCDLRETTFVAPTA
jgi:phenylacetate-CoA ligase